MAHDRKLVIGGVALVKARFKNDGPAIDLVRDELELLLVASEFFDGAPFQWIGLIIRYGRKDDVVPEIGRVNKRHGDLPVAFEMDVSELIRADVEIVRERFRAATLAALIAVGNEFGLPVTRLLEAKGNRAQGT